MTAATCHGCGAAILWLTMASGAKMPVDPREHSLIVATPAGENGAVVKGYVPHWATCPNAKDFKR